MKCRQLSPLVLGFALVSLPSLELQSQNDPGPRPGPPAAGSFFSTLNADEQALFNQAQLRFRKSTQSPAASPPKRQQPSARPSTETAARNATPSLRSAEAAPALSARRTRQQTHASIDLVAACAGLPYGLAEAIRQLQEVRRPVLLICVEKFSDKIGSVRTSRMIFGDGAAAMVIGPVPETPGATGDVEVVQTYASGPHSEVNSIIWPNDEFGGDITVYGPEVKALVQRYLAQMLGELGGQRDPDDPGRTLLESIELIIPHQANKTMILSLADLSARRSSAATWSRLQAAPWCLSMWCPAIQPRAWCAVRLNPHHDRSGALMLARQHAIFSRGKGFQWRFQSAMA